MLRMSIAVSLAVSMSANASIVDLGNITRDTDTGLEWLDVTETRGLSFNQVTAKMGKGGIYEGWRYATMAEFDQLITDFGYQAKTTDCAYAGLHCDGYIEPHPQQELIEHMIRTLGDTYAAYLEQHNSPIIVSPDGAGFTYGMLATHYRNADLQDTALVYDLELTFRGEPTAIAEDFPDAVVSTVEEIPREGYMNGALGSFLVRRPSEVPVPSAVWLFLATLAVFFSKEVAQKGRVLRFA